MCFPGLTELSRPQRELENKSRTEETAVSLCAPTTAAHATGLQDQSWLPALRHPAELLQIYPSIKESKSLAHGFHANSLSNEG